MSLSHKQSHTIIKQVESRQGGCEECRRDQPQSSRLQLRQNQVIAMAKSTRDISQGSIINDTFTGRYERIIGKVIDRQESVEVWKSCQNLVFKGLANMHTWPSAVAVLDVSRR